MPFVQKVLRCDFFRAARKKLKEKCNFSFLFFFANGRNTLLRVVAKQIADARVVNCLRNVDLFQRVQKCFECSIVTDLWSLSCPTLPFTKTFRSAGIVAKTTLINGKVIKTAHFDIKSFYTSIFGYITTKLNYFNKNVTHNFEYISCY